ncbi:MAG: radical SAM protein [Chitinophagales bacterium]
MNISKIKKIITNYPTIANLGYSIMKKYWNLKAHIMDYQYPSNNKNSLSLESIIEYNKNRIIGPKKRFCYAPFNNIHFQVNGNITLCSFNKKLIIGNIKNQKIIEVWNNSEAIKHRKSMADYNLEKCRACNMALQFKNYSSLPPSKYDIFSSDDAMYPTQMSFEMSNLCNYECIMCNEELSSSIRKSKKLLPIKNVYPDDFIHQLKEFIPHLKITTFIGGEPLIIKSYYSIWEEIIKNNKSCSIHIQTNGSYLPNKFLELLESGQFEIGVSLDAINKEKFENIRINAKYEVVIQNIEKLITFYEKGLINMNINFCLMSNNWQELPDVIKFCNERNLALKIILVYSPLNYDIKHMHPEAINLIYDTLSIEKNNLNTKQNLISKKNYQSYIDTLNSINNFTKIIQLNTEQKQTR